MVVFSSEINRSIHLQIDMHYGNLKEHKWIMPYSQYLERSRGMPSAYAYRAVAMDILYIASIIWEKSTQTKTTLNCQQRWKQFGKRKNHGECKREKKQTCLQRLCVFQLCLHPPIPWTEIYKNTKVPTILFLHRLQSKKALNWDFCTPPWNRIFQTT